MEIIATWGKAIPAELWQFLAIVMSFAVVATIVGRLDSLLQQGFVPTADDALCLLKFFIGTGMAASLIYYPGQIARHCK